MSKAVKLTEVKPPKPFAGYDKYAWKRDVDYRKHPEEYRVGKGKKDSNQLMWYQLRIGEQGVLMWEPYKGEIGPYWRFKTPEIATDSSDKITKMFLEYLDKDDFVGADMARKYLQMGFTRARR